MKYKIKNWDKFQHFRDRRPPWIKLYRDILDQRDIMTISSDAFRFLICLWLMASEDNDGLGTLPSVADIAWRLKLTESRACDLLKQVDIMLISEGCQDDAPETETETEKRRDRVVVSAYSESFDTFWAAYPKKVGKNAAWRAWSKSDLPAIDVILTAIRDQAGTDSWRKEKGQFIPNPATWINAGRWMDETKIKVAPKRDESVDIMAKLNNDRQREIKNSGDFRVTPGSMTGGVKTLVDTLATGMRAT